jgi:hypothetical protein
MDMDENSEDEIWTLIRGILERGMGFNVPKVFLKTEKIHGPKYYDSQI